jgi:lipopolysaccharide export system permease protein
MNSLSRYIFWQHVGPLVLFTGALTGVIWLTQSLRMIDLIINNGLSLGTFIYMSGLMIPSVVALILPIGVFCAALFSVSRMNRDSEVMVMWAAGLSRWEVARPVLLLAMLVTLITYSLNLYFTPAGLRTLRNMVFEIRSDYAALLLKEGEFTNLLHGLTVYVRERQSDGQLLGILVHDNRDPDRPVTLMAEQGGLIRTDAGPRFVMYNGNRQQVSKDDATLTLLYFDRYTLDLEQYANPEHHHWIKPKERFIHELFYPGDSAADRQNLGRFRAEAHKRLSSPLYALMLAALAAVVLLSGEYNRRGQGWRIFAAIAAAVLIRVAGLGLESLAIKKPDVIPGMYLVIIIPAAISFYILARHRRQVRVVNTLPLKAKVS